LAGKPETTLTAEEHAEQQRQADELNETIAKQADAIRRERLSKRIETQRAHEKAINALREEKGLPPLPTSPSLQAPGMSPALSIAALSPAEHAQYAQAPAGSGAHVPGSSPSSPESPNFLNKGKEREYNGAIAPSSPVSLRGHLWPPSSPTAASPTGLGERSHMRSGSTSLPSHLAEGGQMMPTSLSDRQLASPLTGPGAGGGKMTDRPGETSQPEPDRVLVGNLIGEDHVNYVMMYNMLTGIRIGVSQIFRQERACPGTG
jgi:hypothetical protein